MSEFKAAGFSDEFGNAGPDLVGVTTFTSPYYFVPPSGSTAQRPQDPGEGMIRFNTDSGHLEYYTGELWVDVIVNNQDLGGGLNGITTNFSTQGTGTRGLFAGGYNPSPSPGACTDTVDYITIETLGNSQDFGNLVDARHAGGQLSDRTRAVYAGGRGPTTPGGSDTANITFTTIASTGDYADSSGDLSAAVGVRGTSNSTRGLFGSTIFPYTDTIEYVTIQSLGNAIDFGNLTEVRGYGMALSSPVRGIFAGGINNPTNLGTNVIDYVTISSTGNAQDFGDLTGNSGGAYESGCAASSTRGVIAGGTRFNKNIDFFTMATTGNSQNFGDLDTLSASGKGGTSSQTRGVFAAGSTPSPANNIMEFITIAATGNAVDFGDLTRNARLTNAGVSNGHGGL